MTACPEDLPESIVVEVPATSANLGVGFDCMGMALDLWARFTFARSKELVIDGCQERFRGRDNLAWTSYLTALAGLGSDPAPVHLTIDSPIPLSGGLGSSSTCVVAGIVAAQAMTGMMPDLDFTLDVATQIEGHPDNVSPAVLGGLVSSFVRDGKTFSNRFEVADNLRFVVIAPPYEVRTEEARKVLPQTVPLQTAVWQMGRCVACVEALEDGDSALFGKACEDRIHEPFRKELIPDYEPLRDTALSSGADAFFISGSGSSMIALTDGDAAADEVACAFSEARPGMWVRRVTASQEGARVIQTP